ncbi:MAG: hypothetical protein QOG45_1355 [Chloroflexota bacterium]|nr:hypothetical protein [Chloroflexota bacterium]
MRRTMPVALSLLGALATGCSDGSSPVSPLTGTAPGATPTPVPTTTGPVPVTLRHFPAGLAVIGLNPSVKQLTIEIRAAGLAPGTTRPARLMSGSCAHPGTLLHALDPLVFAANSVADVTTTVNDVTETEIPQSGWYLAVYRGAAAADQGVEVLCGDLDNPASQGVITAGLGVAVPPGGPDPQAAGTATLTIVGGQLKVAIDATGLTPGSTHVAQLRRGNCEGEGAPLHPLEALVADARGHAVSTTTVPGVAGIPLNQWFVGVTPKQAAVLDPVLCGNVGT